MPLSGRELVEKNRLSWHFAIEHALGSEHLCRLFRSGKERADDNEDEQAFRIGNQRVPKTT